jgi:RNA polymerase sigma-70 factor (ECF subfamily)
MQKPFWPQRVSSIMGAAAALDLDAQLMLRVKSGDDESFVAMLEKHRSPVISFLYRMTQNRAVAEELGQEVFLRIYRSRASYEPTAKFTTWLFRIATHIALNALRDGKHGKLQDSLDDVREGSRFLQVSGPEPSIEQTMVRSVKLNEVRRAIAALPPTQRAAVLMHKYEELGYAQIAGALGCSESAVKSLLFRAYEHLRNRLAHMA